MSLAAAAVVLLALTAFGVMKSQAAHTTPIGLVAIDTATSGNTATSVGAVTECSQIPSTAGSTIDIDVVVDSIPTFSGGHNGISGYQFEFNYDSIVFNVTAADNLQLIAAGGGTVPFDFSDAVPDSDGTFVSSIADFGTNIEDGVGILTRFILTVQPGAAPGPSNLTVTAVGIADAGNTQYTITTVQNALLSLGQACPTPTPTPTSAPTPSPTATALPTATASQSPTASPAASPSATPTPTPGATPTLSPTVSVTPPAATTTPSASPEPTTTAAPAATHTPTPTEPLTVKGDANCSGSVDAHDALTILLNAATGTPIPCPSTADVNCDGVADLADVLIVLSWLGDLPVALSAGCPAIGAGLAGHS